MKKLLYTLLLLLAVITSAFAADDFKSEKDARITASVLKKFETEYSSAQSVTWTLVDNLYRASFLLDGKPMSVYYNWENKLVATTYAVEKDVLSEKALARIVRNYAGYEVTSVLKQFDGTTNYFAVLTKADKAVVVRVADNCVFFHKRLN